MARLARRRKREGFMVGGCMYGTVVVGILSVGLK
jgi:hypothetical protein